MKLIVQGGSGFGTLVLGPVFHFPGDFGQRYCGL